MSLGGGVEVSPLLQEKIERAIACWPAVYWLNEAAYPSLAEELRTESMGRYIDDDADLVYYVADGDGRTPWRIGLCP